MTSGTAGKVLDALRGYDLKEEGNGKYRSNSPLRPSSNSRGFTLVIHSDETGAFFDHVSQESGSLYDLAERLGIELPRTAPVLPTKRPYAGIQDYAEAHGVTAEVLRDAGWHETIHLGRPALAFKTATGTRWRFLDGEKPHYISPKGYQTSWYGLSARTLRRLAEAGPLVICNGEISTVVARHYGVSAACVTSGEKAIPPGLLEELKVLLGGTEDAPPIIVAFDRDETGQRAGRLVTRQLRDAGFIARAVDLGLGKGGDLADFCMLHGEDTTRELNQLPALPLEEPPPQNRRGWYIIPAAELQNLPPIQWLFENEIPARSITVLFGPSGSGKSFLALDYALRLAQTQPVVYMAGEGGYGYRQRVAAWCQHHQKTEGRLFMCIGAVQLLVSEDLEAFLQAIESIKPPLVVIDTLARSMVGSDENSTRDMGLLIHACELVKDTLGCAVLLIHHTNKGGVQERGNSALRGASDAMIKVQALDDLIRVECAKTKDARPFPTAYKQLVTVPLKINGDEVESAVIIDADRVEQTPDDPLTPHQEQVLRLLKDEAFGATRNEIADATGIPYHSLQRILSRLRTLELIEAAGYGKPYQITQTGIDRLDRLDRPDPAPSTGTAEEPTDQPDQPDQLGEKVDRPDRPESPVQPPGPADQGNQDAPAGDQPDQPALIPTGDSYYGAGL